MARIINFSITKLIPFTWGMGYKPPVYTSVLPGFTPASRRFAPKYRMILLENYSATVPNPKS
jgi:hypothetical protein